MTALIKDCLRVEHENLSVSQEAFSSLIFDDMAIDQKVIYDRQVDKRFGLVGTGSAQHETTVPQVANRL